MQKILFVCHGNICRSPMAEHVMKHLVRQAGVAGQFEIDSAATSREEIGNDIYPPARRKLQEKGISYSVHAARQITPTDYAYYDHIIAMDSNNLHWLQRLLGDDRQGKISLLLEATGEQRDVADPWYTGDFETTYQDILHGCQALLEKYLQ